MKTPRPPRAFSHITMLGAAVVAIALTALSGCSSGPATTKSALVEPEGGYAFWPPLPNEPRVQFLRAFRFSSDIEPKRGLFDDLVFGPDREVLPIGKPYGVAVWKDRLYVCDITNPGVVILDLAAGETRLMGTRGAEAMVQPTDIAIAPDGMKYVVDRRVGRIFVFDANDRHVSAFGWRGFAPVGVVVRGDELLVPDFETQSVLVLDRLRGEKLGAIGSPGGENGQFIRPLGVDTDGAGDLYVTDVIRCCLQKFDHEGGFVFESGQTSDTAGNFVRPKHLAVAPDGIIFVVDAAFQNVQMFDEQGQVLMFFGSAGDHPGSMSLPAGIALSEAIPEGLRPLIHPAFDVSRIIVVTNQYGLNKVSVYAFGGLRSGRTIEDIMPGRAEVETGLVDEEGEATGDRLIPPVPPDGG